VRLNLHLNRVLGQLLLKPDEHTTNNQLIECIDLTLLNQNSSKDSLIELNHRANQHPVAAVCVAPNDLVHLKLAHDTHVATVVNFPQGKQDVKTCLAEIDHSLQKGAQEIDYVIPYTLFLEGKKQQALQHAAQIVDYCKERHLILKVIIETGVFSDTMSLYELAGELIEMEVDFLKTSTGKIHQGASFSAVFTLLSAINDSEKKCGIKISGGIKTADQARSYAYLAQLMLNKPINKHWFRIGASSLIDDIIKTN
jgi:deoxyribose-phosphate aldolase